MPRKSVVRLTDRPDMTLDVYRGPKTTMQQQQQTFLKAIKSHFKESYDKQNLTLVVISYDIYETRRRLVS